MKKLPKEIEAERQRLINALGSAKDDVESEIEALNLAIATRRATLQSAIDKYNDLVGEAVNMRENAASTIQEYIDEKSERWQEGERGQEYVSWAESWNNLDIPEIEVEIPDEIEIPSFDALAVLTGESGEIEMEFPG